MLSLILGLTSFFSFRSVLYGVFIKYAVTDPPENTGSKPLHPTEWFEAFRTAMQI